MRPFTALITLSGALRVQGLRFEDLVTSVLLTTALLTAGCSDEAQLGSDQFTVHDSSGVLILEGPKLREASPTTWHPQERGAHDLPIVEINDARQIDRNTIAVLDRVAAEVRLLSLPGLQVRATFGGHGEAPGEFRGPEAIVGLAEHLVVWDPAVSAFHIFDRSGRYQDREPQPEYGDLGVLRLREDQSAEDTRLRVRSVGSSVWLQIEDNELSAEGVRARGPVDVSREGAIVRGSGDFLQFDTVLVFEAQTRTVPVRGPTMSPGVLSPQPRWAVGERSLVFSQTDEAMVEVYDHESQLKAIVRWDPSRHTLGDEDRLAYARALLRERPSDFPASWRGAWQDEALLQRSAAALNMASHAPQLTGLEVSGSCLWIAELDLESSSTGAGSRWHVVDLRGGVWESVRLAGSAPRLTTVTAEHVLARDVEDDGRHVLSVYQVPVEMRTRCDSRRNTN